MSFRCRVAQFTSVRYGERLAEIGAVPSIGSCYKAELIRGPAGRQPWKTVEGVELATLG